MSLIEEAAKRLRQLEQAGVVRAGGIVAEPSTLEKMVALRSVSIFDALEPEDLVRLARASTQVWFTQGEVLCREGAVGDEVFAVLAGEVAAVRRIGEADRIVATQGEGSCIGELSVLDSAPREATMVAASIAVRALRLDGRSFREAMNASPAVADGIIRLLHSEEHMPVNIGNPCEMTVLQFAEEINRIVGNKGGIKFVADARSARDPQRRQPDITRARAQLG